MTLERGRWWRTGLLILVCGVAFASAQPMNDVSLVGELRVSLVASRVAEEGARTLVPASLQARLQVDGTLHDGIGFRVVAHPALLLNDGTTPGSVTVSWRHGLREALLVGSMGAWDVSAGLQRWPLGEMRLAPLMARDVALGAGDPRGVWGVRGTGFLHPWRVEVGVTAESARLDAPNDVTPGAWGTALSLRYDAAFATLAGHAHTVTAAEGGAMVVALGGSASTTLASLVPYGEVWWASRGHGPRAGVGFTGFLEEVSWTVEGGWGPSDARLRPLGGVAAARLQLRGSASLPVSARQTLDVVVGTAWPGGPFGERATEVDAAVTWLRVGDAHEFRVTNAVLHAFGVTTVSFGIDAAAFF